MSASWCYRVISGQEQGAAAAAMRLALRPFSWGYGGAVGIVSRRRLRAPVRLPCRVISVGNITTGGTGKTTITEYVVRYLLQQGRRVCILSRGYGRRTRAGAGMQADEPQMLSRDLGVPVIVDADRVRGAALAVSRHRAEAVVLDDGYQQWHVAKDLDILAVDASRPFGDRRLLPAGVLREPLAQVCRAAVIVITKSDLAGETRVSALSRELTSLNPGALQVESVHAASGFRVLSGGAAFDVAGKRVLAFCGIGDPDSFERMLALAGAQVAGAVRFEDHHQFTPHDAQDLFARARALKAQALVTTEKDAVRWTAEENPAGLPVAVMRVSLKCKTHEKEFLDRLDRVFRA
jgi:tetraacyldisaccharide 4'-kinase